LEEAISITTEFISLSNFNSASKRRAKTRSLQSFKWKKWYKIIPSWSFQYPNTPKRGLF